MKHYIVWNNDRSEGFVTTDKQLAYEVRKSSDTNCYDENGRRSEVGVAFCDAWGDHDCTTQEIDIPLPTEKGIEFVPKDGERQKVSMTASKEQERSEDYEEFRAWCDDNPHFGFDTRLHQHGGPIERGGYISDPKTSAAFAAWCAARRIPLNVTTYPTRVPPDTPNSSPTAFRR